MSSKKSFHAMHGHKEHEYGLPKCQKDASSGCSQGNACMARKYGKRQKSDAGGIKKARGGKGAREGAPGIEPDTAYKRGMQLHQRPHATVERQIYF
jgi:hypothetical protein